MEIFVLDQLKTVTNQTKCTGLEQRSVIKFLLADSPVNKKFWALLSLKKVLMTVFWGMKGVITIDFVEKGLTVISALYYLFTTYTKFPYWMTRIFDIIYLICISYYLYLNMWLLFIIFLSMWVSSDNDSEIFFKTHLNTFCFNFFRFRWAFLITWFCKVLWHINHYRLFNTKSSLYTYIKYIWFGLVGFYGISTIIGYLMPNPLHTYILNIYDLVWLGFMAHQPL